MLNRDDIRACATCGVLKPPEDFYTQVGKGGHRFHCKSCLLAKRLDTYGTPIERFEQKVLVTPGCWIWLGPKRGNGYGQFGMNGKSMRAHRVSYEFYIGPIPKGMMVCHKCDNRPCINPDHLFLGSQSDNMADCARKGRKRNWKKLTPNDVIKIRADQRLQKEIAVDYGISQTGVSDIKNRKYWKHV